MAGRGVRRAAVAGPVPAIWALPLLVVACGPGEPPARYSAGFAASFDASATELIVLRDETGGIEAAIAPSKGGELSGLSLRHAGSWIETLHRARDYAPRAGFGGKGPLLWPATGRNFPADLEQRRRAGEQFDDGAYDHGGVRRQMPIHGFARDLPWTVESTAADDSGARALLSLQDSAATRQMYAFGFRCEVEYAVLDGRLELRYAVTSGTGNSEPMFFSIGNHVTFAAPLVEGSDPALMVLETPARVELLKTDYGTPTGESRPAPPYAGEHPPLAAVSLSDYPQGEAPYIEYRDPAGLAIRIAHSASHAPLPPAVLFNLWGDVRQGFFSPEPWVGLQNSLVRREGLVFLEAGETFSWTVEISHSSGAD